MDGHATNVVDDLWIALATDGAQVLNSLVRLQRKQFAPPPEAAGLGVPSTGMAAFLLAAGREGLTPAAMSEHLQTDSVARRSLASIERTLADQVSGVRRLHAEDVQLIGATAGLAKDVLDRLVERVHNEHPVGKPYCQVAMSLEQVIEVIRTRPAQDPELGTQVILTSIGAVLRFERETQGLDLRAAKAELHGVVVDRKKYPDGMVLVLTDGLDSVKLIARRQTLCFGATVSCATQDRIRVTGVLGLNRKQEFSVVIDTCERLVDGDMIPANRQLLNDLKRRGLPPRVLLGTVVQEVDALLREQKYARFEPSIVSSALAAGGTVEPLDLYFPGLGAKTNLVPSPAPQLIRAGIGLGIPKLYATSRIITRTIRDGFTSPDSPATFIFLLNVDLESMLATVETLLWTLLERLLEKAGRDALTTEPPWPRYNAVANATDPSFHRLYPRLTSTRGFDMTPFVTCIDRRFAVAEGHVAHISKNFQYAIFSLQEERLLQLFAAGEGNRLVRFQGPESILIPGVSL